MITSRGTVRWAGVLFLVSTAAYMIGSGLIGSVLDEPDILTRAYSERVSVLSGVFLELVNSAAVVGIAVLLFPVLKRHHEGIALGYLSSRIIESVLLLVGLLAPLVLIALSEDYTAGASVEETNFLPLENAAIHVQEVAFQLAMLVLGLGSIMLCFLLYRARMIPRFLSMLGLAGYAALMASSALTIMGYEPGVMLFIPGGLFELLFPIWLISKGFPER